MKLSTVFLPVVALLSTNTALAAGGTCGKKLEHQVLGIHREVDQGQCGPAEFCDNGICVAKVERGGDCSGGKRCLAVDFCDPADNICKFKKESGTCSTDDDCHSNVCVKGSCLSKKLCGSDKDCTDGLICRYPNSKWLPELENQVRACRKTAKEMIGQACSKTARCKGQTRCQFGVCLYKHFHLTKATNGLVCRRDSDCQSGNCEVTTHDNGRLTLKYCAAAKTQE